ncbi:hypothetical protein R3W88_015817 [Solanum pinnatisectum]|uniref:Uncharacterized protein n=1 Tax=Solanum pinnatisectum TaxID=50273 RepID=A0AAV9KW20_9SOLN|nr:hypothetical protein R3W88_015817 [Solanum pinnatisectum]
MLTLEEAGRAKKAAQSSSAALVARSSEGPPDVPENFSSNRPTNGGKRNHNRNNTGGWSRGNTGQRRGSRGAASSGRPAGRSGQLGGAIAATKTGKKARQRPPPYSPWIAEQQWPWMASWGPWVVPPCPYPSTAWSRPNYGQQQPPRAGVLGPAPAAYTAALPYGH